MVAFIRREEESRAGSDLSDKLISEFSIFEKIGKDATLKSSFVTMQDIYVFDDSDKIDFDDAITAMGKVKTEMLKKSM